MGVRRIPISNYKAAYYVMSNNIDTKRLARRLGLTHAAVQNILYNRSIKDKFTAMAFAYALNCDFRVLLDDAWTKEDAAWKKSADSQR